MYILAIETTGPVGSLAVIRVPAAGASPDSSASKRGYADERPDRIPMKITTKTMSHLKNLMAMVRSLLDEKEIAREDITAVAASCGPGSFTGIRIGVSTARALAQAWDVPCIAVSSLEVFRQKCGSIGDDSETQRQQEDCAGTDGSVCVVFNARRGQVYGACYRADGSAAVEPGPYMLTDILDRLEAEGLRPVFYGDGVDAYFDAGEYRDRTAPYKAAPPEGRYQTARMAAVSALEKWMRGDTIEYGKLLPDYMRESEAEQRLRDGSLEKMRKEKLKRLMRMAGK